MTNEQIISEVQGLLNGNFTVKNIINVNHKPHPYTIGPKHIGFAADRFGGMLGESAITAFEKQGGRCAHPNCRIPYGDHTSDRVMFLQLVRNLTKDEAQTSLQSISPILERELIDGITFVDTDEKFRIS